MCENWKLFTYLVFITTKIGETYSVDFTKPLNYHVVNKDWPHLNITFGQLSSVTLDNYGNVVVFHRGEHIWNQDSFAYNNTYLQINQGPINVDTIIAISNLNGSILKSWGKNLFYMPHGLTIDKEHNVWVTDVALHQVFKYSPDGKRVLLTLGVKFEPGSKEGRLCKPTAVAVVPENGDFFVSDGYCNRRIIKYSKSGLQLAQIGTSGLGRIYPARSSPYNLLVPHALAVIEKDHRICVADREHGRIVCYDYRNGSFATDYRFEAEMGTRLFSLAYSPVEGGKFFVVNGASAVDDRNVRGYVINIPERRVEASFGQFALPHDIAVTIDGTYVFVCELKPNVLHRFEIQRVGLPKEAQRVEAAPPVIIKHSGKSGIYFLIVVVILICFIPFVIFMALKRRKVKPYRSMRSNDEEDSVIFYNHN